MPMKSQAQRKFLWANEPEIAKRWEKHTPKGKLPKKLHPSVSVWKNKRATGKIK